jgi:hypothetical protein
MTLDTLGGAKGSMGLGQESLSQSCQTFEHINVLCVRSQQQTLLCQQWQQIVCGSWLRSGFE